LFLLLLRAMCELCTAALLHAEDLLEQDAHRIGFCSGA